MGVVGVGVVFAVLIRVSRARVVTTSLETRGDRY